MKLGRVGGWAAVIAGLAGSGLLLAGHVTSLAGVWLGLGGFQKALLLPASVLGAYVAATGMGELRLGRGARRGLLAYGAALGLWAGVAGLSLGLGWIRVGRAPVEAAAERAIGLAGSGVGLAAAVLLLAHLLRKKAREQFEGDGAGQSGLV